MSTVKIIIDNKIDAFRLEPFFLHYVLSKRRNYKIYCIDFERLFESTITVNGNVVSNIEIFNERIGIPNIPKLYPKKPNIIQHSKKKEFEQVYDRLIKTSV